MIVVDVTSLIEQIKGVSKENRIYCHQEFDTFAKSCLHNIKEELEASGHKHSTIYIVNILILFLGEIFLLTFI